MKGGLVHCEYRAIECRRCSADSGVYAGVVSREVLRWDGLNGGTWSGSEVQPSQWDDFLICT